MSLLLFPAVLLIFAAFFILSRRHEEMKMPGAAPDQDDGIDREELERAEREVQEMDHDGSGAPPPEQHGDDWGPGTPPRPIA